MTSQAEMILNELRETGEHQNTQHAERPVATGVDVPGSPATPDMASVIRSPEELYRIASDVVWNAPGDPETMDTAALHGHAERRDVAQSESSRALTLILHWCDLGW
jgi:hypothetical protein